MNSSRWGGLWRSVSRKPNGSSCGLDHSIFRPSCELSKSTIPAGKRMLWIVETFQVPKSSVFFELPFCRDFLQFIMWPYDLGLSVLNLSVSISFVVCKSPCARKLKSCGFLMFPRPLLPCWCLVLEALDSSRFRRESSQQVSATSSCEDIPPSTMAMSFSGSVLGCWWLFLEKNIRAPKHWESRKTSWHIRQL